MLGRHIEQVAAVLVAGETLPKVHGALKVSILNTTDVLFGGHVRPSTSSAIVRRTDTFQSFSRR